MVNIKDLFQEGYKYHQSGDLAAAATFYIKILDKQPEHTDTIFLTGTLHLQQGNFDAAIVFLKKAIALKPDYVTAYVNLGIAQQSQGKFEEAIDCYRLAIRLKPDDAEVYKNLGNALREKGELDEAIVSYRKATVLNPNDAEAYNDLGATLQKSGKLDEAIESHRQAIRLRPDYAKTHNNLGTALKEQGKHDEAIASYRQALSLKPDYAEAHNNLGIVLQEQEKFNEAIASYNRAIALKPDYAEAYYNLGNVLKIHGKTDEAIKSYKQAITLKQNYATAYVNLGIAFQGQGKSIDAISCYKKALEIKSDYASAYYNLGAALQEQGKLNEATCYYQKALELKPDHAEAHNNLGVIFQGQGKLNEAISCYQKALELKPDNAETYNNLFHQFQQTCAWQKLEDMSDKLDDFTAKALDSGTKTAEVPFVSLARHTDPSRVFAIARSWSDDIARAMSTVKTHFSFDGRRSHKTKIVVGYLSNNFCNHPMAHLTLNLYGLHNRDEFKIFCYSYGEDDGSPYSTRIRQDCDKFVDLRNLNYADAARCIYEDQVDILVDLKGHTRDNKLEICALRPAPVQVRYLGLAGTTGADFFDYIITDRIITPEEHAQYYSENFAYLPHCYQVNDSTQEISNKDWKKSDFGLPEDSFVFCSFNQGYKIEPVMFNTWMNILRQIPESVLWLKRENEITEKNLRQEAERRGVEFTRLIFSGKLSKDQHLGRLRLADVALDTRIVNGAITTSDALWAGVPVITLQGGTFPSQMSSSILTAIGLPELITQTLGEYESLAIDLVHNSSKLQTIRQKLTENLSTEPLFDTPRFTKNLEKAYKEMWKIFMAEKSPRQIDVMVNIKDLFQEGYKYHQSGNLAAAATCYNKILDKQPEHIDTIFLAGTLLLQQGDFDAATAFLKKAIELKPDYATAYSILGAAQQSQGKFEEAIDCYRLAIRLKPDDAEVYKNLGNALRKKGELDEAIVSYRKATVLNPNDAEAYNDLGAALQKSGKLDEAIESYRQAIRLRPNYAKTHNNLGTALKEQGKHDEAIASYRQALSLKPDYAEAHNNLGIVLQEQEKFNEAIANYNRAIALKPDYAEAYYNLANTLKIHGKTDEAIKSYKQAITLKQNYATAYINLDTALQEQGEFDDVIACYRQAIALKPDYADAHNNLGIALKEQGKLNEAIASYDRAISLIPDYADAHNNLGSTLQEQGKLNEAIASYDRAIAIKPDYAEAHMNKSFTLLLTENFEQGWQEYEWRLRTKNSSFPTLHQPGWDGTPLNGRSILVHAEQGLGDTIQFVRYLPMVRARGGYVIFKCQPKLFRLLQNCKGFDEIIEQIPTSEPAVQFDVHIPLLSLPGIFGTTTDTIPSEASYITANPNLVTQWQMRLGHNEDFKIGIVWAGNPKHKDDRKRSCSLADFAPLANIPDLTFYSLQKGPASTETCNPPENMKLINLENELNDFTDTAAVIANLDLVISVDTAVAHLAGGLGKPVWNLLYFAPDWRWLLNRNDSPWYPRPRQNSLVGLANGLAGRAGMHLFRQTRPNDWAGVFEQVKKALITQYSALKV